MPANMTVPCDNGLINLRVGAIILKDGKFLMAGNERDDYLYSVGGRLQFGETAEEAVVREAMQWVSPDDSRTIYPEFYRTELADPVRTVKHFVTDER